jgi:AP-3 complex subunit delta
MDPAIMSLPPDIIAAYLQSMMKVFSQWAVELADNWDEAIMPELKEQVETVIERLGFFAKSADIEVQERVCDFVCAP